jgi:hypothetical protein
LNAKDGKIIKIKSSGDLIIASLCLEGDDGYKKAIINLCQENQGLFVTVELHIKGFWRHSERIYFHNESPPNVLLRNEVNLLLKEYR